MKGQDSAARRILAGLEVGMLPGLLQKRKTLASFLRTLKIFEMYAFLLVFSSSCHADLARGSPLETQTDKVSYVIGIEISKQLKRLDFSIDLKTLEKGIKDGLSGDKPLLDQEELRMIVKATQDNVVAKMAQAAERNKIEGQAFLEENKTQDGVVELPSGLQYKVIREGKGPRPKSDDTVLVHYMGALIDGTVFSNTYESNEPVNWAVNKVVPGWTEALQLMPVGSKWRLFIPPELAYRHIGAPPMIGPEAVIIYEIELIAIK
ncbi:FKBP-type peptidyl-prolyl cis-trans isomerase N-terminal domain-containing protein [Acidobacteriota bacterium]